MDWLEKEIQREYHEVAQLFPLMQGDEFEELKATALIDGHVASIFPSVHKGYFYISHVEGQTGIYEYLDKPVHHKYIAEAFTVMGINVNDGQWITEKCQPLTKPPYTSDHPSKRPEQFVYFIEGAGRIKIGVAECPEMRLETLQAGSPVRLKVLATCGGGHKREGELHKQFAHLRLHGEWFDGQQELLDFIEEQLDASG